MQSKRSATSQGSDFLGTGILFLRRPSIQPICQLLLQTWLGPCRWPKMLRGIHCCKLFRGWALKLFYFSNHCYENGSVKITFGKRAEHDKVWNCGSCTLPKCSHLIFVAAKLFNVLLDPLERFNCVQKPCISGNRFILHWEKTCPQIQWGLTLQINFCTKWSKSVVGYNEDHVSVEEKFRSKLCLRASYERATVEENNHRQLLRIAQLKYMAPFNLRLQY